MQNITNDGTILKQQNYLLGLFGALLGAIVGAIPWAIVYCLGWFVGWLGFLIGIAAVFGYNLLCKKKGIPTVLIIIISVIIGVAAGQVMGDFLDIALMISKGEIQTTLTYANVSAIYSYALQDAEILLRILGSFAIGLLFAALGTANLIKGIITDIKAAKNPQAAPALDTPQNPYNPTAAYTADPFAGKPVTPTGVNKPKE